MTDEEQWDQAFKEGKLSQDELDSLKKGKRSVQEMDYMAKEASSGQ